MNKALFLDRDGVINEEVDYLYRIEDVVFIDEIFDICRFYRDNGFLIIVITNQAGIARGYYTEEDFSLLTLWITSEFEKKGIQIQATYHCPHHPDIDGSCLCRKPEPGMIFQAQKEFNIDLTKSVLIGDKLSDIEAGLNAGIENSFHIEEIIENMNNLTIP